MEWVSGIGRDENGQLCLEAQWHDGPRATASLSDLRPGLGVKNTVRRRVDIDLAALRPTDAAEYLKELDLPLLNGRAQRIYMADTATGTVLFPSQLLALGLFGSTRPLREVLFRPWGPTLLMNVVVNGERLEVASTPNKMLKLNIRSPATDVRMAWVLSYPSATAGWCSVYANALNGRFDVLPPKAIARVSAHGKMIGGTLFATRLQVLELTATEAPFEFAEECASRHFVFDERALISNTHGKAVAPTADHGIAGGGHSVVPLTDEEWACVEPLILDALGKNKPAGEGGPRLHALRDLIGCIRLKLGTPYSWSKCPGDKALVQSASVLLSKLQRAGVWEQAVRLKAI